MNAYGKITVLAGGPSSEREISLKSGRAVYEALKRKKQDADFVDVDRDFFTKLSGIKADIMFIALHGRFGEDGTVQAMLEKLRIPYTGSGVEASKLAMDKIASRERFIADGIKVPRYRILGRDADGESVLSEFKIPFVVKPQREGSSIGLSVVRDKSGLGAALKKAFEYGEKILIEEYIHGRELTVGVFENRALPVVEIMARNEVYDYRAKYEDGETAYVVPARLKDNEERNAGAIALKAHSLLGCRDFSRVDMRMDAEGNIFVLEVNTIPGLTERSLLPKAASAVGIDFEELCMKLIGLAHKRRNGYGEK